MMWKQMYYVSCSADMPLNSEDRVNAVEIATQFQNMAGQVLSEAAEATDSAKTQVICVILWYGSHIQKWWHSMQTFVSVIPM